ncbi:hypothetical protein TNCV_1203561 [Trichonephila clavipes]|nr:hypothetical protein TNCV_1203561 [Trichonephila clavipes]
MLYVNNIPRDYQRPITTSLTSRERITLGSPTRQFENEKRELLESYRREGFTQFVSFLFNNLRLRIPPDERQSRPCPARGDFAIKALRKDSVFGKVTKCPLRSKRLTYMIRKFKATGTMGIQPARVRKYVAAQVVDDVVTQVEEDRSQMIGKY